ncbi:MAG: DUF2877 domain-containing protein [Chloroflexi bacterium]|nr:DUF2877 domain-containing protein [Chloroflexota bacterium]
MNVALQSGCACGMYLKAISIGDAIPRTGFDAAVHSVFKSAINLISGDTLLTLVTSNEADLPQGIRVDTPKDFSFEIFNTGEPAICRDNILRLNSLTIQLHDAKRWKCDLPALHADLTNPAVSTSWQRVWQILNQRQTQLNAEIIAKNLFRSDETIKAGIPRKANEAIKNLFNATRQYNLTNTSPLRALIGLGTGLTPSGDDLLVGYLSGLWCSVSNKSERIHFVTNLGKTIVDLSPQTNDISRAYLYHASHGQVSSHLANLAEAICHGENSNHLAAAAESALQVGHTSGMDAVTGLLLGFTVWETSWCEYAHGRQDD